MSLSKKENSIQTNKVTSTDIPGFQKSNLTIRLKLMVIISSIIFLSLSVIIYLASFFFKKDSETRIRENDLQTTNLISLKLQAEYLSLANNMTLLSSSLIDKGSCEDDSLRKMFFQNSKDIMYIGIFDKKSDFSKSIFHCLNPQILNKDFSKYEDYEKIITKDKIHFKKAFQGLSLLKNQGPDFKIPVLSYTFPFLEGEDINHIIVSFIRISNVQETFSTSGVALTYLVDEEGNLLIHPDKKKMIAAENLSHVSIVKSMLTSKLGNSQLKFEDEGKTYMGTFNKLKFIGGGIISTTPEDKAFEEVYNLQKRNIFLMIIVLSLTILIVFIYSKTLTNPILDLVGASKRISEGDYTIRLLPKSGDEIGILTDSFNSMTNGLEEREKLKVSFGKFVNKELAEMAMKGDIKLGGDRKYCAIFFSDIRSFTSISEKLEPEEVVEFLNAYMTEMVKCVNATGGIVDKFIGDAIMATWGALNPLPNETEAAITASLMMREALLKFNIGRGTPKKPIIKIGCGINSGYVISGQIGSDERLEYTVIGDAVNLASRIESLNKPFGADLLISQDSYEKVKHVFKVEKMPAIKVKGKEEPQTIFAVLGRLDDPNCYKSMKELRKAVGIDYEDPAKSKKPSKGSDGEEKEVKYEILQ
jgi:adenylate cyclase